MTPLIRVPIGAVEASVDALSRVGHGAREVAVFWLGEAVTMRVSTVVVPVGPGVTWGSRHIHLDEAWMLSLADLCDSLSVVVLGGVHTHPADAFMSGVDRDAFFHAPDFVSVVLPDYGRTRINDATGSWAVYAGLPANEWSRGSWADDVEVVDGEVSVIELGGPDVQTSR